MRVQEMIIGARGDVVVKVFGDEIADLNRIATQVAAELRQVPAPWTCLPCVTKACAT